MKIIVIAGPNGAGKTTFARQFLPNEAACSRFINADLIAAGLSPFDPAAAAVQAGRLMLTQIAHNLSHKQSFAIETTLSGHAYAKQIPIWQKFGYQVELFFLSLSSPELAIARVAQRVKQGGHDIPEAVIRRRYAAGLRQFETVYKNLVDVWALYNNDNASPTLLDAGANE